MLSQAEIEEIAAFNREHRRRASNGRLWRGTERYNYLRQTGGEALARDYRRRPDIEILNVAVKLDKGYSTVMKTVGIFEPSKDRLQISDIYCAACAGWIVRWAPEDTLNTTPHPPQEARGVEGWQSFTHIVAWGVNGFDWRPIVNRAALKGSRFEYCGFGDEDTDIIRYLSNAAKYPEIEYLKKRKLEAYIAPSIISACRRDRKLYEKAMARAAEFKDDTPPSVILWALRHDKSLKETREHFKFADEWSRTGVWQFPFHLSKPKIDYEQLRKAAKRWKVSAGEYWRYLNIAHDCKLDLKSEGVKYPPVKGGREAFMARMERLEAERARRQEEERKKERKARKKRMANAAKKWQREVEYFRRMMTKSYNRQDMILPASQKELRQLGGRINNCVGNGRYWERILKGECLILEIRKGGKSAYCVEIGRPHYKVLQCYGRKNTVAPAEIRELADYMAKQFKMIEKYKQKEERNGVKTGAAA